MSDLTRDIINDPTISQAITEDPLFRFLYHHWRQVTVIVVAIAALFYARHKFHETYLLRVSEAAELFTRVGQEYESLEESYRQNPTGVPPDGADEIAALSKRMDELLTALSDSGDPYAHAVPLYRGLVANLRGDPQAVAQHLSLDAWESVADLHSAERMFAELRALAGAKSLLDTEARVSDGKQALKNLAQRSAYVRVTAAYTLSRVLAADEKGSAEKAEVIHILEATITDMPEQAEVLEPELKRIRGS